jgi:hypothetical protein
MFTVAVRQTNCVYRHVLFQHVHECLYPDVRTAGAATVLAEDDLDSFAADANQRTIAYITPCKDDVIFDPPDFKTEDGEHSTRKADSTLRAVFSSDLLIAFPGPKT